MWYDFFAGYSAANVFRERKNPHRQKRNDLPWLEKELDEDFEKWIYSYPDKSLPKIYELLEKYADNKRIYIFKSRSEIDSYLKSLVNWIRIYENGAEVYLRAVFLFWFSSNFLVKCKKGDFSMKKLLYFLV